jgi:acyl-CoA synthetase (AMP-forming)/AMP-acid ligase II
MHNSSVALLRERAGVRPNDLALRHTDYEQDRAGVTESVSWQQLYQRSLNVARAIKRQTEHTFGGTVTTPPPGAPKGPWLRTGGPGFASEGEIFIVGRVKDPLIGYGRSHYPDDIESTVQQFTRSDP